MVNKKRAFVGVVASNETSTVDLAFEKLLARELLDEFAVCYG